MEKHKIRETRKKRCIGAAWSEFYDILHKFHWAIHVLASV